jgi:hypothetical protein
MSDTITLEDVFLPSNDVVAREIEGELIIIPLVANIGDLDEELYTLNETGRAIWNAFAQDKSLGAIASELAALFAEELETIQADVIGLVKELYSRKIVTKFVSAEE